VAAEVTSALEGVVRSGTGQAANIGGPVAGKTGTAENFVDAWFCGYVPRLATCVWIGNPRAETPMHDVDGFAQVVGGSVPARIWRDFMAPATPAGPPAPPASVAPPPPA
jgi:penicillin-binding protein 1A